MMRVAYLITDLDLGGAERNLAALAQGLDRARFDVSVASLMPGGRVAAELRASGIPATDMGMTRRAAPAAVWRVVRWLRSVRPDLLHTWLFHANFVGRLAARAVRVRTVVSSIRVAEPRRSHLLLERLTAPLADCILTNSPSLCDYMREHGIDPARLRVIPNAVDIERFAGRERTRRNAGAAMVLFVGRLAGQKGVDVLLRAAAALCSRREVEFNLVGEGPDRRELERLARELNLTRVHFLGRSDRVADLLASADVLVLPSRWEGLPNVVLEAMAARCPVVASDVIGTRDLVQDGVSGLLVPPDDPTALAAAIERMLSGPALRQSLASAAFEVARRHSISAMVSAHAELYTGLHQQVRSSH